LLRLAEDPAFTKMQDSSNNTKLARERVRDDATLTSEVASTVSAALGLSAVNQTLGRTIVRAALDAHLDTSAAGSALERFKSAAAGYGDIEEADAADIFRKVVLRLKGTLVQLAAQDAADARDAEQEDGSDSTATAYSSHARTAAADSSFSFSAPERRLHAGTSAVKGGLVERHTFTAPKPRPKGVSLLGLDKLAEQKRAAAGITSATTASPAPKLSFAEAETAHTDEALSSEFEVSLRSMFVCMPI
jgi:hypothetical protein